MINLDVYVDTDKGGPCRFAWTVWESSRVVAEGSSRSPLTASWKGQQAAKRHLQAEDLAGWIYVHRRHHGETLGAVTASYSYVPRSTKRRWRAEKSQRSNAIPVQALDRPQTVHVRVPAGSVVKVRGGLLGGVKVKVRR